MLSFFLLTLRKFTSISSTKSHPWEGWVGNLCHLWWKDGNYTMSLNAILVWTLCLMHRCVCIWQYILQNYNYKLHFQNLYVYHIPHVFIGTLAVENLDVCTACDPWDNNIQLTMVKDRRWQIYPNIIQCLTLTLVDCHHKCHLNRKLTTTQNKWPISPERGHDDAR